jgi:hypothetical protein
LNRIRGHIQQMSEHSASLLLLLLVSVDVIFIVLHITNRFNPLPPLARLYRIDLDQSYPEIFQYIKFLWIAILFIYLMISRHRTHYFAWVLVFIYFFFDDSVEIREGFGRYFSANYDFSPFLNLRLQDIGELIATAILGLVLLVGLVWDYVKGDSIFRRESIAMFLFIGVLVFFGTVLDMVHVMFDPRSTTGFIIALIEDGGEMLIASLTLWYVFLLAIRREGSGLYLNDLLRRNG